MPDMPDSHDLWHEVNQARLDIAELRGMVKMHFEESAAPHPTLPPRSRNAENNHVRTGSRSYCDDRCNW